MKKNILFAGFYLILVSRALLFGLDGRALSFQTSGVFQIPLGEGLSGTFKPGGGGALTGSYRLPFAADLSLDGGLDIAFFQSGAETGLSVIGVTAGAGLSIPFLDFLSFWSRVYGGYGLGLYNSLQENENISVGGSPLFGGETGIGLQFSPGFSLNIGGGYRHWMSTPEPIIQSAVVRIGASICFGAKASADIDIPGVRILPIFPVFQTFYDDNPLGSVIVTNTEKGALENVEVSFFVDEYMESPKKSPPVASIEKDETVEVPLYGLFNEDILTITEGRKANAKIVVRFDYRGNSFTVETSETVQLYDRNAMTWDDDRKAAAFITAKNPEVLQFAKGVAGYVREKGNKAVNLNFRIALGLFEALRIHGLRYVVDPQTPYAKLSGEELSIDYLQFPAQTLGYKAGDCDDLSILYCALLESTGIETAFVTVPGHIFASFSLGLTMAEAEKMGFEPNRLIDLHGDAWIPVEVTLVQDGFLKAWEWGAMQWNQFTPSGTAGFFPVHEAWELYRPVGLQVNSALSAPLPEERFASAFTEMLEVFVEKQIADKVLALTNRINRNQNDPKLHNQLGILYAQYGFYEKAKDSFRQAARLKYNPAFVNLGNVSFLKEEYADALEYYKNAEIHTPRNPAVLLGMAKANYELKQFAEAGTLYRRLKEISPLTAEKNAYLGSEGGETARASSAVSVREHLYWDDGEIP